MNDLIVMTQSESNHSPAPDSVRRRVRARYVAPIAALAVMGTLVASAQASPATAHPPVKKHAPITVPVKPKPVSTISVRIGTGAPIVIARRQTVDVTVTVHNGGTSEAKDLRVHAVGTGLRVRPATRSVASLAAGADQQVTFRVRRTSARSTTALRVRVSGKDVTPATARAKVTMPMAKVTLSVPAASALRVGESTVVEAKLANSGTAAAKGVRLHVRGNGVRISPMNHLVGEMAAGSSKTVAVTITRRATKGTAVVRFTVTRPGAKSVMKVLRFPVVATLTATK